MEQVEQDGTNIGAFERFGRTWACPLAELGLALWQKRWACPLAELGLALWQCGRAVPDRPAVY